MLLRVVLCLFSKVLIFLGIPYLVMLYLQIFSLGGILRLKDYVAMVLLSKSNFLYVLCPLL